MADDDGTAFNAFRIRLISSSTASTIKIQKDTDKVRRTMLLISIIGLTATHQVRSWMIAFAKDKFQDIDLAGYAFISPVLAPWRSPSSLLSLPRLARLPTRDGEQRALRSLPDTPRA